MRITKSLLQEYLDAERNINKLTERKNEIRKTLLRHGSSEMGNFTITVDQRSRLCPISVVEIKAILGSKAALILQTQKFKTVKVRRK